MQKSILALVLFLFGQLLCVIPIEMFNETHFQMLREEQMAWALFASGIITIAALLLCRVVPVPRTMPRLAPYSLFAILGAGVIILSLNMLSELIQLPDIIEEQMLAIVQMPVGMLSIGILGPIVEELVFRAGITGSLLRSGYRPVTAIVGSALVFGIIHFNPSQIPYAFAVGLLLAIIYWKTGNILLSSLIHIMNNSASVIQVNIMGDRVRQFSFTDGMSPAVALSLALVLLVVGILVFRIYFIGNVSAEKRSLRSYIRAIKNRYMNQREQLSLAECRKILGMPSWQDAGTVLLYSALADEADTTLLLEEAEKAGKHILLPVVVEENLELREYTGPDNMQPGAYGIMEPTGDLFPHERFGEIDFVLVPGMAFDYQGNRLGRGKGYYDRLLPQIQHAHFVGLCFPFQRVTYVPHGDYDVRIQN